MTTPHEAAFYLAQEAGIQVPQDNTEHYTDLGLARRLVSLHGQDLRYSGPWAKWLVWTGQRWARDDTLQVVAWCKDTIKGIYADALVAYTAATEAAANNDKATQDAAKDKADALYAWAVKSEATARIAAAIDSARSEPGIPVTPDELDVDVWLLNVQNGTIDLHTGQIREHRREDMITKLAPVDHDPTAQFELWDNFIAQAIPDATLRRFIQKAAGSCLTGDAPDDVLLFLYGPGGAGKGTFIGGLLAMLGDYGTTVELDTFTNDRNSHGPRPDLAALRGMRMVVIEEVDDRQTGIVAMLKKASGGTSISTRSHHQETFTFTAQFKLWLLGNKRPRFPDDDSGLWRRLRILPFMHVFANPDPTIRLNICTSSLAKSRILNWALEGCAPWQQEGLGQPPKIIQDATELYRDDLDPLMDFLSDCTVEIDGATYGKDLWSEYQGWCRTNAVKKPLGRKGFGSRLAKRYRAEHAEKGTTFIGVGLRAEARMIFPQIQADTSRSVSKADVPLNSLISPFMGENTGPQIETDTCEVSADAPPNGPAAAGGAVEWEEGTL